MRKYDWLGGSARPSLGSSLLSTVLGGESVLRTQNFTITLANRSRPSIGTAHAYISATGFLHRRGPDPSDGNSWANSVKKGQNTSKYLIETIDISPPNQFIRSFPQKSDVIADTSQFILISIWDQLSTYFNIIHWIHERGLQQTSVKWLADSSFSLSGTMTC